VEIMVSGVMFFGRTHHSSVTRAHLRCYSRSARRDGLWSIGMDDFLTAIVLHA